MTQTVPAAPSLLEIATALTSGDARTRTSALSIRPPDQIDPRDVKAVQDAARAAEASQRGGLDIKT